MAESLMASCSEVMSVGTSTVLWLSDIGVASINPCWIRSEWLLSSLLLSSILLACPRLHVRWICAYSSFESYFLRHCSCLRVSAFEGLDDMVVWGGWYASRDGHPFRASTVVVVERYVLRISNDRAEKGGVWWRSAMKDVREKSERHLQEDFV